jgi:dolichol-phosphate mannosyltransferase
LNVGAQPSATRPRRVTVVLPTYNEAENLPRLVAVLRALDPPPGILVVDDGSPDGTGRMADALAHGRSDLQVIHREGQRGFGEALTAGFRAALAGGADALVTMDADFSHDPADVPRLVAALDDEAVLLVIGSRYTSGGEVRDWPLHRRVLSTVANTFVSVLFALPARDCTSGFRVYRREALAEIPWARLRSPGYSFLVEVLYWATRSGRSGLREVPICFTERRLGRSKMGLREIVWGAANLLRLRAELLLRSSRG